MGLSGDGMLLGTHSPEEKKSIMVITYSFKNVHRKKNTANFMALTPLSFLERTKTVFPEREAVVYRRLPYRMDNAVRYDPKASRGPASVHLWQTS